MIHHFSLSFVLISVVVDIRVILKWNVTQNAHKTPWKVTKLISNVHEPEVVP